MSDAVGLLIGRRGTISSPSVKPPHTLLRALPVLAVAAVLAPVAAGCGGGTVIDSEAAEEDIRAGFAARDVTVTSVDCPSDADAEAGTTYECVAETPRGTYRVIYRQLDADGTVSQPRIERESKGPGDP